jgi:chorismate synthase
VYGEATDASGVANVEALVQDNTTGLYWNALATTWGSWNWNQAIVQGPRDDVDWSFTVVPSVADRQYTVRYRATDVHGNVSSVGRATVSAAALRLTS